MPNCLFMGPFHMLMSYFKAVGKFITDSGLTHILTESGVRAQGSLAAFWMGQISTETNEFILC